MHISKRLFFLFCLFPASLGFAQINITTSSEITAASTKISSINLSQNERSYLTNKKNITVCADPSWMPFEAISNGQLVGMSADFLKLVSQQLGVHFQLVPTTTWTESLQKGRARKCDIFPLAMATPERKQFMAFTRPYIVIPLVIATAKDKPFIADLADVAHKKIGLVKGYAFTEFLKAEYPEMELVEFDTLYDGLLALEQNEIY